jgi:quinol-cytochrome oxidoreductase complex cytochrome b subunit
MVESQFWRSLFRHGYPDTPLNQSLVMMSNVFLHLHPVKVSRQAMKITYTWCMGGITFFLFLVLTLTGVFLMFYYVPDTRVAYQNINQLSSAVSFGHLVRNMHRWAAHLMVVSVTLYMIRVFYHGAYKPPREFNWVIGVLLFLVTLFLSFTGYLLPWDQIAIWAITVGTNLAPYTPILGDPVYKVLVGGASVTQQTLLRFYVGHVIFLPLIAALLMAVHFWRIRKDGGAAGPPPPPRREVVPVRPGPRYVWVEGYHRWDGNRYYWQPGAWVLPPARYHRWVPGHWVNSRRGYYWVEGHWR